MREIPSLVGASKSKPSTTRAIALEYSHFQRVFNSEKRRNKSKNDSCSTRWVPAMAATVLVGGDREGLVLTLNGNNIACAGSGRAVRNVFVVEPRAVAEDIHISQAAAIAWMFQKKLC